MRIARIEAFEFRRTLDGSAWNPHGRWHERRAPLLRIVAADGSAGIGEGWSDQAAIAAFFVHARVVATELLGRNCDDIDAIHATLMATSTRPHWVAPAVASAVDMALWDLRARSTRLPLHALLCGAGGRVAVYASGGLYGNGKTPEILASEMEGYARHGFTSVKMKIGGLPLAADLARVASVRQALGPNAHIMVDAVEQLTANVAPSWMDALARLGVKWVQAPLPAGDLQGMAALQARGPPGVVAQEREHCPAAFQQLLDQRAVGMLQFCPALAGGFTGGLALLAMARNAGVPVTLQCHATAVLQAACFHLGAGRRGIHSVEYHRFHTHLSSAMPTAMRTVQNGELHLDARPGLGLDPGLLDRQPSSGGSIRSIFRVAH